MGLNIIFASSNESKASEAVAILAEFGIDAFFAKLELREIQSNSLEEIAKEKSEHAYSLVSAPVIVEDDGLFIESLRGFPGQYS
ncbi:MAG TPA: non-canonical purine NTP pyrophosphatase, partial [Nitrososphaera sp.]|nr:non-canonical purine NTP pyrophosphatase [Nitrososphaera sp.]